MEYEGLKSAELIAAIYQAESEAQRANAKAIKLELALEKRVISQVGAPSPCEDEDEVTVRVGNRLVTLNPSNERPDVFIHPEEVPEIL